jgi:hypothetical protein
MSQAPILWSTGPLHDASKLTRRGNPKKAAWVANDKTQGEHWRRAGVWAKLMSALADAHDAAVQMIDESAS